MSINPGAQQVNPPHNCEQITVTNSAQTLAALLNESAYKNLQGIQINNLSGNTNSIFWGLLNTATISAHSSEIPPGAAQVIPPSLAADSAGIYLVASGSTGGTVVFLGG